jgi:Zn-dependent peptidase ImmA (M78 family)/transcriptional regulator with XRE-family HTH domain
MVVAHINGKMLAWARNRAGFDLVRLAKGKITVEKLKRWEAGEEYPTENQAMELADKLGISYAMLFMPTVPPPDNPPIPDLRTLSGQQLTNPSLDFRDVLNSTLVRQDWIREERSESGFELRAFVGRYNLKSNPRVVAADMRHVLALDPAERTQCADLEAFIRHLVSKAEDIGVLVMRSAVVGHDTHRALDVNEFRGFALSDGFAPVVFINDADAKAAQIFTIAHELAHIWIGADGVSDRRPNQQDDSTNAIELFCDKVAAEVLAPESEFLNIWRDNRPILDAARAAATHFRVSTLVALRRAKDLNRIPFTGFIDAVNSEYDRFRKLEKKKREKQKEKEKSGGNFWASFEIRNGRSLNRAIVAALVNQRATFTEASALLGVTTASTIRYLRRIGAQ